MCAINAEIARWYFSLDILKIFDKNIGIFRACSWNLWINEMRNYNLCVTRLIDSSMFSVYFTLKANQVFICYFSVYLLSVLVLFFFQLLLFHGADFFQILFCSPHCLFIQTLHLAICHSVKTKSNSRYSRWFVQPPEWLGKRKSLTQSW